MPFDVRPLRPQRIAVIGGGISGLASAYRLGRDHDVTVFEAAPRLGGVKWAVDSEPTLSTSLRGGSKYRSSRTHHPWYWWSTFWQSYWCPPRPDIWRYSFRRAIGLKKKSSLGLLFALRQR